MPPTPATRRTILANLFVHAGLTKSAIMGRQSGGVVLDLNPGDEYPTEPTVDTFRKWAGELGLVRWEEVREGRSRRRFTLGPAWGHGIGIVVGYESIRCAIGGPRGDILRDDAGQLIARYRPIGDVDAADVTMLMRAAAELAAEVLAESGVEPRRVRGITLALPAPVRHDGTVAPVRLLRRISSSARAQLGERLRRALTHRGLPAFEVDVDNDANMAGLGEWHIHMGRAEPPPTLLAVKVGGGIGAALVDDLGRVLRGARGTAGELGHVRVNVGFVSGTLPPGLPPLDPNAMCRRCQLPGHLESYASGKAIVDRLMPDAAGDESPDAYSRRIATVLEMLDGEPPVAARARRTVEDAARLLARAVTPLLHFTDPSHVVLTGRLQRAGDRLLDPFVLELDRHGDLDALPFVELGEDEWSGVRGAIRTTLLRRPPTLDGEAQKVVEGLVADMLRGPRSWRLAAPLLGQPETQLLSAGGR